MRSRHPAASVYGIVLALAALSGSGCSAIISPDTSRFGPDDTVDGGDPPVDEDGGVEPERDADVEPERDGSVGDGGVLPIDGGGTCTGGPRCEGTTLTRCEDGRPIVSTCPVGCSSDGTRCGDFVPSNVGPALWIEGAEDATVSGRTEFDTSMCSAMMAGSRVETQPGGPDVCVLQVRNLTITEGASLVVLGSRPLIVMATGDVEVRGTLDVSARGAQPGPGGSIGGRRGEDDGLGAGGGEGGQRSGTYEDGGGAGGAFCGAGGAGGAGGDGAGGRASARVDATALSPLRGGSGGGIGLGGVPFSGGGSGTIGLGGAGGGAVQISARGRIRVSGSILGGGGGGLGGGGSSNSSVNYGAGGGGGSGGSILLEAPEVLFDGGAVLGTSGGAGAGGASGANDGGDGQDGGAVVGRAIGGASGGVRYGATGGDSGGGATGDAEAGASNAQSSGNGGGGGGGVGCIVVRNASGSLPAGTMSGWSPSGDGVLIARVRTL